GKLCHARGARRETARRIASAADSRSTLEGTAAAIHANLAKVFAVATPRRASPHGVASRAVRGPLSTRAAKSSQEFTYGGGHSPRARRCLRSPQGRNALDAYARAGIAKPSR